MNNDDYTAVETFEECRYVMKQLFKSWFIGLAVLAVLVLLYAHLSAQNYSLHWVEVAIQVVGLPFIALLCTWFLFFTVLVFGTWRFDYWRTRELRQALIPPLPGNSPDDRGAQMLARFKRVKKWAKSAYVVKYRNNLEFVMVPFPDSVDDEEEFERSLAFVGRRLAQSTKMHYGAWEDLTIGRFRKKHYKFLVLRK